MGLFRRKKNAPRRDAAAQWRVDRSLRRSFAPAYFGKQALLFILLTMVVFVLDLVLFVCAEMFLINDGVNNTSPSWLTYTVSDSLQASSNEDGTTTYELADVSSSGVDAAMWLDESNAWALLVSNDGEVLWSYHAPDDVANRTYSTNELVTYARTFYFDDRYPSFFSTERDDGTVVVGFPEDAYVRFPISYMGNREFIVLFMLGIALLYIDALIFFMVYSLSRRRMLKAITPAVESLDDLAHGVPTHMEVKGPLAEIADSVNAASAIMQHKDSARKRWISGVSHDVRTPLAISMGHAERIANAPAAPAEVRESGEVIVRQNERIRDLVEDLNIASKLEYDSQPMDVVDIAPVAFARDIVADYLNAGLDAQYDLEFFSTPAADDAVIRGDRRLLRRAVRNLVDNSMRHNGEGCRIALSLDVEETGMLAITVADNGRGCDTAHVAALMAQASSPDASYDAHGLGLTLVSRISLLHGGYVSFASEPGRGFTATMRIPVKVE